MVLVGSLKNPTKFFCLTESKGTQTMAIEWQLNNLCMYKYSALSLSDNFATFAINK
jgi:hypothetical protein